MKRFAALLLIIGIGLFTIGCQKGEKPAPPAEEPTVEAQDAAADETQPADDAGAAAEEKSEETAE